MDVDDDAIEDDPPNRQSVRQPKAFPQHFQHVYRRSLRPSMAVCFDEC